MHVVIDLLAFVIFLAAVWFIIVRPIWVAFQRDHETAVRQDAAGLHLAPPAKDLPGYVWGTGDKAQTGVSGVSQPIPAGTVDADAAAAYAKWVATHPKRLTWTIVGPAWVPLRLPPLDP